MTTKPGECPNYAVNKELCPRTDTDGETYAICCECVLAAGAKGDKPLCMSGIERAAGTRGLPIGNSADCRNRPRNTEACACYETSCSRRGVCCDCIRFHWGHNTWPKVACV